MPRMRKLTATVCIFLLLLSSILIGCGNDSNPTVPSSVETSAVEDDRLIHMTIVDLAPDRRSAKLIADVRLGEETATMVAEMRTTPNPDATWQTQVIFDDQQFAYATDHNELGGADVGDRITPQGAPAIIAAVAVSAIIGGATEFVWYSATHFGNWKFNEAVDATVEGMIVGAALGPIAGKAEGLLKPIATKWIARTGKTVNLRTVLSQGKRLFNEVVEAIKKLLR